MGHIPSFCTACYREGRTGDRFMTLVKSGQIANCCQPNALLTLKEYLEDYAAPQTKALGERLIAAELLKTPNERIRALASERLRRVEAGERDFYF
jgi:2-iminoacetate synthase